MFIFFFSLIIADLVLILFSGSKFFCVFDIFRPLSICGFIFIFFDALLLCDFLCFVDTGGLLAADEVVFIEKWRFRSDLRILNWGEVIGFADYSSICIYFVE